MKRSSLLVRMIRPAALASIAMLIAIPAGNSYSAEELQEVAKLTETKKTDPVLINYWKPGETLKKLNAERAYVYEPSEEWTFSHHAHITHFQGRFYAMWSNGLKHEDHPGQRVMISSSEDFRTWTKPYALSAPPSDGSSMQAACGFYHYNGTLVAYFSQCKLLPGHLDENGMRKDAAGLVDNHLYAVTTTDGIHWSKRRDLNIPTPLCFGPQATPSGRLIMMDAGQNYLPYSDDPSGLDGWHFTKLPLPSPQERKEAGMPHLICEPAFYAIDKGPLILGLRTSAGVMWMSESHDDGATWEAARPTEFSDNCSKFHFGRLPDGRYYCVNNADPAPLGARARLMLSLSKDGYHFDQKYIMADEPYEMRTEGLWKHGTYGYPHSIIVGNYLYVIASQCKESIAVIRVDVTKIPD